MPPELLAGLCVSRRQRQWDGTLARPGTDVFVVEDDGVVAGFASLASSQDTDALAGAGELTSLYLLAAYWGRGYGRALMATVLETARARGYWRLTLWVLAANQRARGFYEAAGFAADGSEKTDVRPEGVVLHECRYFRLLSTPAG